MWGVWGCGGVWGGVGTGGVGGVEGVGVCVEGVVLSLECGGGGCEGGDVEVRGGDLGVIIQISSSTSKHIKIHSFSEMSENRQLQIWSNTSVKSIRAF